MNQTWENGKKPNVGSKLAFLAQIWVAKGFLVDFASTSWENGTPAPSSLSFTSARS